MPTLEELSFPGALVESSKRTAEYFLQAQKSSVNTDNGDAGIVRSPQDYIDRARKGEKTPFDYDRFLQAFKATK